MNFHEFELWTAVNITGFLRGSSDPVGRFHEATGVSGDLRTLNTFLRGCVKLGALGDAEARSRKKRAEATVVKVFLARCTRIDTVSIYLCFSIYTDIHRHT
jgi:hypothetical protein